MTNISTNGRSMPSPENLTSYDLGIAMRERAEALKSKLPFDLEQTIDIFLDMAAQVVELAEDRTCDQGKSELVANLYRLDELLPE